jgi:hypothetical protein
MAICPSEEFRRVRFALFIGCPYYLLMNTNDNLKRKARDMKAKKTFRSTYCPSGKVRYRTEEQAKSALRLFNNRKNQDMELIGVSTFRQTRVYFHHECRAFHTTSQPKKGSTLGDAQLQSTVPEWDLVSMLQQEFLEEINFD